MDIYQCGDKMKRKINDHEVTDLLKAMLAPVRPYDCVFSYSGGAQKSIKGNHQFFEMDQNRIGGVVYLLKISVFVNNLFFFFCVISYAV